MGRLGRVVAGMTVAWVALAGCTGPAGDPRSGGDATVVDDSANAFSLPIPSLTNEERRAFFVGNSFFNDNWVTAPASTEGRDGLGPMFNAQSCSSCHFRDGRARPPESDDDPALGLLIRLSVPGVTDTGAPLGDPAYGDQLQDRSIHGVPAEGRIRIDLFDRTVAAPGNRTATLEVPTYRIVDLAYGPLHDEVQISPRIAPQLPGVGLLEAIPVETILALADPDDSDGDGISGRPNMVWDVRTGESALGRFGWKANVPTVEQQNAGAFLGDIGITSSLFPEQVCTAVQTDCAGAPDGGSPEVDDHKLARVTFYTQTLAVPARRDVDDPDVIAGERLFDELGCAACHVPTLETGPSDIEQLAHQTIHAYTDLLLHDMGPDLADDRPDFDASGSEWRTAPLWGLGLIETVNDHLRLLHDGRARSIEEAILWHGGEAETARQAFQALDAEQMQQLIAFLESL